MPFGNSYLLAAVMDTTRRHSSALFPPRTASNLNSLKEETTELVVYLTAIETTIKDPLLLSILTLILLTWRIWQMGFKTSPANVENMVSS